MSVLLDVAAIVFAVDAVSRGLDYRLSGAIAAALIASIFLVLALVAARAAIGDPVPLRRPAGIGSCVSPRF